jgi:hypothetical protein
VVTGVTGAELGLQSTQVTLARPLYNNQENASRHRRDVVMQSYGKHGLF